VVVADQERCASVVLTVTATSMAASFKDRKLLAVIGDEVTLPDFFWPRLAAKTFPVA